jgi:hypothetical protein
MSDYHLFETGKILRLSYERIDNKTYPNKPVGTGLAGLSLAYLGYFVSHQARQLSIAVSAPMPISPRVLRHYVLEYKNMRYAVHDDS